MERVLPLGTGELCLGTLAAVGWWEDLGVPWDVRGARQGQGQHAGIPPLPLPVRCPVPSIPVPQSLPQLPCRLSLAPAARGRAPCCQGDPSSPPPRQTPGWGVLGTALGPAPLSAAGGQSQVGAGLLGPLGGFAEGSSSAQARHGDGTRKALYHLSAAPGGFFIPRWGPVPG